jgi:hypothetical protein
MTVIESVTTKLSELPLTRQLEVLDFVEFLAKRSVQRGEIPRRNPEGLLADQPSNLTLEDFKQARREMSAGFPRDL